MSPFPQLNWNTQPLLLVYAPILGYAYITLEQFRRAGPHAAALTVVAIVPEQHAHDLLGYLPQLSDELLTIVWPKARRRR